MIPKAGGWRGSVVRYAGGWGSSFVDRVLESQETSSSWAAVSLRTTCVLGILPVSVVKCCVRMDIAHSKTMRTDLR